MEISIFFPLTVITSNAPSNALLDTTKTTELLNGFKFSYHCPANFCQPTSSNSFPACIRFDQREAPEIPTAEFSTQGRLYDRGKNIQINLIRKIIEDFIEEGGDFVTGTVSDHRSPKHNICLSMASFKYMSLYGI